MFEANKRNVKFKFKQYKTQIKTCFAPNKTKQTMTVKRDLKVCPKMREQFDEDWLKKIQLYEENDISLPIDYKEMPRESKSDQTTKSIPNPPIQKPISEQPLRVVNTVPEQYEPKQVTKEVDSRPQQCRAKLFKPIILKRDFKMSEPSESLQANSMLQKKPNSDEVQKKSSSLLR